MLLEPLRTNMKEPRPRIAKLGPFSAPPNLADYDSVRRSFSWDAARGELDGLPDGRGLNIAHEAVDRHAAGPRRDQVAICWLGKGRTEDFTYARLRDLSNRFANVLQGLGVSRGDRVFVLDRPHTGALRRRARHAEESQCLLPALLGVRSRADPSAARDRRRQGAGDDRCALRAAEDRRASAPRCRSSSTCS